MTATTPRRTKRLSAVPSPQLPEITTLPARRVKRTRTYSPIGAIGRRMRAAQSLQLRIQELEAQLAEHRAWFLDHMHTHKLTSLEIGNFTVSHRTRHNWTYSERTQLDMEQLKLTQKWEQTKGVATDNPTESVVFTTKKPTSDMQ